MLLISSSIRLKAAGYGRFLFIIPSALSFVKKKGPAARCPVLQPKK